MGLEVRRAALDRGELDAKRQAALEFQATLTKSGKTRKR